MALRVTSLNDEEAEGEEGGGVIVSFHNGQLVREKVGPIKSGPLFNYLMSTNSSQPVDLEKVKQQIAESPVNFKHPLLGDMTALLFAAQSRHLGTEVIDLLLDAGYDIETTDQRGVTPLLQALVCGNVDIAKRLIERGANVHAVTSSGNALYYTASSGNIELAELLLNKGVDINYAPERGELPINQALTRSQFEMVNYLLSQTIQPLVLNSTQERRLFNPPLCAVIQADITHERSVDMINRLVNAGADVNGYGDEKLTPLIMALWRRNLPLVDLLFEKGAKPSSDLTLDELFMACRNKVPNAVRLLIERGANPHKKYSGRTLVSIALDKPMIFNNRNNGHSFEQEEIRRQAFAGAIDSIYATIEELGKHGLNFNEAPENSPTLVPLAAAENLEVFKLLERFGASMNVVIEENTLLHILMELPFPDIVEYVLQKNSIDINAKNGDGMTALHFACVKAEPPNEYEEPADLTPILELLIKHKADLNIKNTEGQTPLMFALAQQNFSAARHLICNGADLDIKDNAGNNIVHTACSLSSNGEKLLSLVTKYAPVEKLQAWLNDTNNDGDTPVAVAKKANNEGLVLLLSGDFLAAASKGVLIFDFAKLNPTALHKIEQGYEFYQAPKFDANTNTEQASPIMKLAKGIVTTILLNNSIIDVVSFSCACRQFKNWSDSNNLWKALYRREYGTGPKTDNPKKELAIKWHTQVNMRKGVFLSRSVPLNPDQEIAQEIVGYAHPAHSGVESLAFDYNSGLLFVGDLNSHITYVNVRTATVQKTVTIGSQENDQHDGTRVQDLIFSSNTLLYHMGGGRLLARDIETNLERQITTKCRELSACGDLVLTTNFDQNVLFNWKTGERLWSFSEGNSSYTAVLKNNIAITGTGANGDTKVRFWNVNTKSKFAESAPQGYATYLWSSEKYAVGSSSHLLECFEIETGRSLWRNQKAHSGLQISKVAINEEAKIVVSVSTAELFAWDLLTGKQLARFSEQKPEARNSWSPTQRQYLSVATKGHLVFGGLLEQQSCMVEVWDVRKPATPVYTIPLTAGPKHMHVEENLLLVGLMNNSIKIVNYNV
eukprot:TRINITY_DN7441_c0_g1_i1.p1 TRINITY_DN7441_c0_g1~~TRINITY_DN7441_c0_g1_i1.p1  ORF type:complete len:1066 (-),score=201.45 TRINITY_DN7441_c0_g1_i1:27-3224(-)